MLLISIYVTAFRRHSCPVLFRQIACIPLVHIFPRAVQFKYLLKGAMAAPQFGIKLTKLGLENLLDLVSCSSALRLALVPEEQTQEASVCSSDMSSSCATLGSHCIRMPCTPDMLVHMIRVSWLAVCTTQRSQCEHISNAVTGVKPHYFCISANLTELNRNWVKIKHEKLPRFVEEHKQFVEFTSAAVMSLQSGLLKKFK